MYRLIKAIGTTDNLWSVILIEEVSPDALEEAVDAFDAGGGPGFYLVEGAHEHFEEAEGVGAIFGDDVVGVDDVAAGFGHFLAVFAEDESLVDEFLERFVVGDEAAVEEDFVPEAGVEEVEDGVFDAADVEVDAAGGVLRAEC
jgi:hypothetical protein